MDTLDKLQFIQDMPYELAISAIMEGYGDSCIRKHGDLTVDHDVNPRSFSDADDD